MMRPLSRRAPVREDAGLTLVEVMVAMGVMSVVMVIATTAITQIYQSVNESENSSEAQTQVTRAFARLDQEIRYARAISTPAVLNGDYYVEYLISADNVDTCVELRLRTSTNDLQRRQWTKSASALTPTSWTTLAAVVTSGVPFTTIAADRDTLTGFRFQRLRLTVSAVLGGGTGSASSTSGGSTRQTDVTFTALNATAGKNPNGSDPNAATCIEARGIAS
ncbi:prepilin-type N-terminal cleavage/methylation domain-containing protein [Actinoplanes sp. NPDC051411]|uniref:PulJ/GspJ family protein n=1 Tax=Actinoplanes sp. NPDC051411 TaxID=3155522 RepID=UPI00341A7FCF